MAVHTDILTRKTQKGENIMDIVHLTIRIDKQLRTDFQIIAKKQDTTATEILTEFIQSYVNENK